MGLETFTGKVSDLVATNPPGTDPKSQGDDHLRGIKTTIIGQSVNMQIGQSATATQNFTFTTGLDGTMKLARGNVGATTQDVMTVSATGLANFAQGMPRSAGDPIAEAGTANGWSFTKFASGLVVAHQLSTGITGAGTAYGTGGLFVHSVSVNTPLTMVGEYTVSGGGSDDASVGLSVGSTNRAAGNFQLRYFTKTSSVVSSTIGLMLVGKWK